MRFSRSEIVNVPNSFTFARFLAIPVFVWLLFSVGNRGAAAWLLGGLGATDWVDGYLARKLDQATEFGRLFDPTVDRLMFMVAIPSIAYDGSAPLWIAVLALAREALVSAAAIVMPFYGLSRFDVTKEGKTGAFLLMFAFPMFLGAHSQLSYAPTLSWLAWVFTIPGVAYSWYSLLFQYLPEGLSELAKRPK